MDNQEMRQKQQEAVELQVPIGLQVPGGIQGPVELQVPVNFENSAFVLRLVDAKEPVAVSNVFNFGPK